MIAVPAAKLLLGLVIGMVHQGATTALRIIPTAHYQLPRPRVSNIMRVTRWMKRTVDKPHDKWPAAPKITLDNVFGPPTPFELKIFTDTVAGPGSEFDPNKGRAAFSKLNAFRDNISADMFGDKALFNGEQLPGAHSSPPTYPEYYDATFKYRKYVHMTRGGYLDSRNIRMNWVAAQAVFKYQNETTLHSELLKAYGDNGVKGKRVLDIGCGTGTTAFAYARMQAAEVIGVDRSPSHVRFCRGLQQHRQTVAVPTPLSPQPTLECLPNLSFYYGDGEDLSGTCMQAASFDIVHITYVLHEMPAENAHRIIKEAHRLLKPGGIFASMDVKCRLSAQEQRELLSRTVWPHWGHGLWSYVKMWIASCATGFNGPEPWMDEYLCKLQLTEALFSLGFNSTSFNLVSVNDEEGSEFFVVAKL